MSVYVFNQKGIRVITVDRSSVLSLPDVETAASFTDVGGRAVLAGDFVDGTWSFLLRRRIFNLHKKTAQCVDWPVTQANTVRFQQPGDGFRGSSVVRSSQGDEWSRQWPGCLPVPAHSVLLNEVNRVVVHTKNLLKVVSFSLQGFFIRTDVCSSGMESTDDSGFVGSRVITAKVQKSVSVSGFPVD